jgi:NAD(P)-dependent dehydrogenase (short-subunit alcohol dehydrogenase family)
VTIDLTGRVVLITGAGAGIGRGISLACATAGANVVVATRNRNGLEVVAEIERRGGSSIWTECDVTNLASVRAAVLVAIDRYEHLDAVIHNATSNQSSNPCNLEDVSPGLWEEHVAVTVRGAYHCAVAAFSELAATRGTLLLMTSPAGIEGSATLPMYATVKGAIRGFAKSLAREWGPDHVRVNVVSPLGVSPAMERAIEADPAMEERLARRVPLGRVGDPETDVGPGVAFLVSDAAHYVTGQTLGVDGGHFMSN